MSFKEEWKAHRVLSVKIPGQPVPTRLTAERIVASKPPLYLVVWTGRTLEIDDVSGKAVGHQANFSIWMTSEECDSLCPQLSRDSFAISSASEGEVPSGVVQTLIRHNLSRLFEAISVADAMVLPKILTVMLGYAKMDWVVGLLRDLPAGSLKSSTFFFRVPIWYRRLTSCFCKFLLRDWIRRILK